MPTICIQCAMKALVEGKEPPVFDEEPEQHQQKYHPDLEATRKERAELEHKLSEMQDRKFQ